MCMTKMPGTNVSSVTSAATLSSSTSGGMATGGPSSSSSSVNRRNASQSDETDSASDEVKVFNDEDEREPAPSSSESRNLDFLTNIKSSLISETEQKPGDFRSNHAAFASLALGPWSTYFPSPYFPNGLANGMARSPFWTDPLVASPPPAHMAAGIRPPMHPYLQAAAPSQYPYSMLSGHDQLAAAWQHQAASMYHAGLRASSPYGLPITSAGLPSPMSRFSPPSLLGHPGLSQAAAAAAAAAGHHHLPQIKQELNGRPSHKNSPSKKKDPHIKKPLNAFMLYMKEMRPVVQSECTLKESAAINQILGRRWHSLSRDEQSKYYEKARLARQQHLQMYPGWNARDNYRFGLKKKKRKRDKSDDPAASMKKCRARYGLDQQDMWCRPCRRKKKCIRVQSYIKDENQTGDGNRPSNSSPNSNGTNNPLNNNDHSKPNQEDNKGMSRSVNSDGEEDDDLDDIEHDMNGDDQSPGDSRNGRESLESNSEQSVTSPAGFASLPSIGSPASVASPPDPSSYESMVNGGLVSSNSSSWFSPPQQSSTGSSGAFKPPVPTSSAFQSAHQQFHPGHPYNAYYGLYPFLQNMPKGPVGTDPRDAKNPLSISQLTGNAVGDVHGALNPPALACNGKEH